VNFKLIFPPTSASSSTIIENFVADLSIQPFCPEQIIDKLQILDGKKKIDVCLIVHNAGTLGDLTKNSSQLSDANQWHEYLQTNLISTIQLNNHLFNSLQQDDVVKIKTFISLQVNEI
jgi:NADP-dependent 3-hydroxy acid dehydrogenase YdfG